MSQTDTNQTVTERIALLGKFQNRQPGGRGREVVPVRHYGRGMFAIVVGLLTLQAIFAFTTNPHIEWSVVGEFLMSPAVMTGLWATIWMSVIATILALIIAVVIAVMRISESRLLSGIAYLYVFIFRGIPLLVLLLLVGNIGLFMPRLEIGIPFTDVVFYSERIQAIVTPQVASIIALTLVTSAYSAEIVRGGLYSVDSGQRLAAKALGLNGARTLRFIVLPQALRVIVPPLGNEFITTLKMSSLVSVIGAGDLMTVANSVAVINYKTLELLLVATFWYLVIVVVWSIVQYFIEKRSAAK